jgi:hypothetical protein
LLLGLLATLLPQHLHLVFVIPVGLLPSLKAAAIHLTPDHSIGLTNHVGLMGEMLGI